mmetsp:Transcript_26522/g.78024  ORF Transcript_26522/g.78024 Transcript_26522/m.78024 type:complete len:203 (-) Transcript_26522:228-836(-)
MSVGSLAEDEAWASCAAAARVRTVGTHSRIASVMLGSVPAVKMARRMPTCSSGRAKLSMSICTMGSMCPESRARAKGMGRRMRQSVSTNCTFSLTVVSGMRIFRKLMSPRGMTEPRRDCGGLGGGLSGSSTGGVGAGGIFSAAEPSPPLELGAASATCFSVVAAVATSRPAPEARARGVAASTAASAAPSASDVASRSASSR